MQDYKGSEGFPFLPTHGVQCCSLVLLTICRDKAVSPISCTDILATFFSSQPWLPEIAPELHPPLQGKSREKKGNPLKTNSKMLIWGDKLKNLRKTQD